MQEERQVFLIQSSGKPANHIVVSYEDRTFADEIAKHFYYRNENWDVKKKDADFGKVRPGGYILVYRTGDVDSNPLQIKSVYEVIGLERIETDIDAALKSGKITEEQSEQMRQHPHVIRLKLLKNLKSGRALSLMRRWVSEGKLSKKMDQCGLLGFNIAQVEATDYDVIMDGDGTEPPPPDNIGTELLEEYLRQYLAEKQSLGILGRAYKRYKLLSDDSGQIGEEYDTGAVGRIDLLYSHEATGELLVVELKRTDDTPDQAAGQLARYVGWVKDNLANRRKVKGLLIVS